MSDEPDIFEGLIPSDPLMAGAWYGCMRYLLGDAASLAAFRVETGNTWEPGRSGIEQMIDKSTGVDRAFFRQFAEWMNANVWGPVEVSE